MYERKVVVGIRYYAFYLYNHNIINFTLTSSIVTDGMDGRREEGGYPILLNVM